MFILLLLVFTLVSSFGFKVHYIIGHVIQDRIDSTVKQNIQSCNYIFDYHNNEHSFANASTWADRVKYSKKYSWTRTLHYYDVENDPPNSCGILVYPDPSHNNNNNNNKSDKYGDNLYSFIDYFLSQEPHLSSTYASDTSDTSDTSNTSDTCLVKPFEFKIFLHLLQDLHQPLHLTGKKRGGNQQIIHVDDKSYNLHSFWDSILYDLVMDSLKLHTLKDQIAFFKIILDKDTFKCPETIDLDLFVKWGNEISKLNCNLIWNWNDVDYIYNSKKLLIYLIAKSIQRSVCILEALF